MLYCLMLILVWVAPARAVDGALDPTFDPGAGVSHIPVMRNRINYEDGTNRFLIYGFFTSINGVNRGSLARFSAAGVVDPAFNPPINGEIRTVKLLSSGKILVGGAIVVGSGGSTYYNLARLNADGTLDTTLSKTLGQSGLVNSIGVQSDGKLLVGGWSMTVYGDAAATYHLLRLNSDGSLDVNYLKRAAPEGLVNGITILSSDRARIYGTLPNISDTHTGYLVTLSNTGLLQSYLGDETFNGVVYSYATQSDGKVVYVGQFTQVLGVARKRIARLNTDGTLDASFDPGVGPNGRASRLVIQSDGRIVVAGNFNAFNGNPVGYMVRLHPDGTVDPTFVGSADDRIFNFGALGGVGPDLVVFGAFRSFNGAPRPGLAYLDSNGNLVSLYSGWTSANNKKGVVYTVAVQPGGRVLIGGDFTGVNGKWRHGLARLHPDGALDTSFNGGVDGLVRSIALQADGKFVVGGCFGEANGYARTSLARFNATASASLDTAFNPIVTKLDGSVSDLYRLVSLSSGQIVIAGHFRKVNDADRTQVARLNADGSLDAAFDSQITITDGAGIRPNAVAPTADGKYVVSGYVIYKTLARGFLCRLTAAGALDPAFGPPGPAPNPSPNVVIPAGEVKDMGLQSDGRIVIVGNFSEIIDGSWSNPLRGGIARFTAAGALDNAFTTNNGANNAVNCLAIQRDGKFLIGGYFTRYNQPVVSDPDNALRLARVLPNGNIDATFKSLPGADDALWAVTLLPAGKKAYVGGQFITFDGVGRTGLARIITGKAFCPAIPELLLLEY